MGRPLALSLFDGAQEKTGSGERRRGGRHWRGRRLRHLSLSDLGMRRKNENNKTEREERRERDREKERKRDRH